MFAKDIGIDLGTANTLIFMKGKGIIMREPSVVAVDTRNDTVRYVGREAKEVIGRTPGSIVAVRPLKDGVIADFDITASMLQIFIKKVFNNSVLARPRIIICIPSGVTEVERRAVREAAFKAGAKHVSIIEEPMAAAIGAGLFGAGATGRQGGRFRGPSMFGLLRSGWRRRRARACPSLRRRAAWLSISAAAQARSR